jgi:hypothetical protein
LKQLKFVGLQDYRFALGQGVIANYLATTAKQFSRLPQVDHFAG